MSSIIKNTLRNSTSGAGRIKPGLEQYTLNTGEGSVPEDIINAQAIELKANEALEEMDQAEAEVLASEPEGEVLSDAIDTYPQVVEVLEKAIDEQGGVSQEAFQILQIFMRSHGIDDALPTVSQESFGEAGKRLNNTRVSVEGIKDTVREWWKKLMGWFNTMRVKVKKWWVKSFSAAAGLKEKAKNIQERAGKVTKGSPSDKDKIKMSGLQKTLFINGKMDSATLVGGLNEMVTLGGNIFAKYQGQAISTAEKITTIVTDGTLDTQEGLNAVAAAIATEVKALGIPEGITEAVGDDAPDRFKVANGFEAKRSKELPGERAIYAVFKGAPDGSSIKEAASALSNTSVTISAYRAKERDADEFEFAPFNPQQVKDVAGKVEEIAGILETYKRGFEAQEKADTNLNKFSKLADKVGDGGEGIENASQVSSALTSIPTSLRNMINEPYNTFGSAFINTGRQALAVCERSLSKFA